MTPPGPGTQIGSDVELFEAWQRMMGHGGFAQRSLWVIFLDDEDRMTPVVMPIDDISKRPDPKLLDGLATIVRGLADDGACTSVAFLLSRPGTTRMTDDDRAWARGLRDAVPAGRRWPIHLATKDNVQVFAPDDLMLAS